MIMMVSIYHELAISNIISKHFGFHLEI